MNSTNRDIAQSIPWKADRANNGRTSKEWSSLTRDELNTYLEGCARNDRESQKRIYYSFYSYAMSVCGRYASTCDDSVEILNDGFLKIFKEIYRFKPAYTDITASFKGWLRKIMLCTAIDHFRRNNKYTLTEDLDGKPHLFSKDEDALDKISYREIIKSIRELTPAYRTVLNLFIIEGLTHEEISKQLRISIGTSKSNLAKARLQLQKILMNKNKFMRNHQKIIYE